MLPLWLPSLGTPWCQVWKNANKYLIVVHINIRKHLLFCVHWCSACKYVHSRESDPLGWIHPERSLASKWLWSCTRRSIRRGDFLPDMSGRHPGKEAQARSNPLNFPAFQQGLLFPATAFLFLSHPSLSPGTISHPQGDRIPQISLLWGWGSGTKLWM